MIEAVRGDITEQAVDAIVNAANSSLPAISTGVYGYSIELAAPVAVAAARQAQRAPVELVRFVLFSRSHLDAFERALAEAK